MKLLQDRVAVISGAATQKGIGLATAQLFAEHGAAVALLDLERQEPQRVAAAIGDAHRGYVCDVTKKINAKAWRNKSSRILAPWTS